MERIPILQMGEFLLVTIQVDMHDRLAITLQDDLTNRIVQAQKSSIPSLGGFWATSLKCLRC
jgi:rsbT antagonist protein RsbS